jgi:hypothetical protein
VKLLIDIMRQTSMMTGMNGSQTTKSTGSSVAVAARCLRSSEGLVVDMEVAVKRMMTGLLAVAVLAAFAVGGAMTAARTGSRHSLMVDSAVSNDAGMMPEVVVSAAMPRLVMPTVEVNAFRTVAVSGTVRNVY